MGSEMCIRDRPGVVGAGAVLDGVGVGSVAKHKDKLSDAQKIFR